MAQTKLIAPVGGYFMGLVWCGLRFGFMIVSVYTKFRVSVFRLQFTIRFLGAINGFGHCDHFPYLTTLLKNEFRSSATLGSIYLIQIP